MPHEPLTAEPTEVTAGTTVAWDRTLSEHPPADGWTLKYAFRGPVDLDVTAVPNGEVYEVRIPASGVGGTGTLAAGTYRLYGYIEQGTERHEVYDAELTVRADPLAPVNAKSHAEQMVEKLEAKILERVEIDEASWSQGQREANREEIAQLERQLGHWRARVVAERNPGALGRRVEARFARAH